MTGLGGGGVLSGHFTIFALCFLDVLGFSVGEVGGLRM